MSRAHQRSLQCGLWRRVAGSWKSEEELIVSTQARVASGGLLLCIALHGVGCQSYAPKPADLGAHHAAWAKREPGEHVAALAAALRNGRVTMPASGPVDQLSLPEAELVALVFNPELRLARARAGVTLATLDHAGLWDDPVLSIVPERVLSGGPSMWNVLASVGLTLPLSGRLEVEKRRAGAQHHASLHAIVEQEWQVRADIRRIWVEWSAARLQREAAADFLERLDAVVRVVTRMQDVGELAPMHARVFLIEQVQRRNEARALDAALRGRAIALRQVMGLPPHASFEARPQIVLELAVTVDEDHAEVVRTRHPRIRTLLAEYDTAERALELAVRRQYPDVELGPGYSRDDGTNRVLLGVSLPIPVFNRNRQAIAEATAARDRALAEVETAYERLLTDLAVARVEFEAATEQVASMIDEVVPLVDRQYADARRVAELGEVDTLLLMDTLQRQYEARLKLIELEATRSLAGLRVIELLGPSEADGLPVCDHVCPSEAAVHP
jgi:outer membrane protein, heavy metal efflux system